MTQGTGKRQYRACQRCRRRKTRCDLETIGTPSKPPCLDCYRSGSECILAGSRRGGSAAQRSKTKGLSADAADIRSPPNEAVEQPSNSMQRRVEDPSTEQSPDDDSDEELPAQLRNPSDALQILAESDKPRPNLSPSAGRREQSALSEHHLDQSRSTTGGHHDQRMIDEYELVDRGLLKAGTIIELLVIYKRRYHPYFPLAPSWLCGPEALTRLQKDDFLLLTVLLTIASRDRNDFSLTHRYCWDHTQRLLLDVLLAQPWTQSPRTVEALLLLSEWLPHTQSRPTAKQSQGSLREDQTAWSLIGQAVRHAYLLKLDRAAFRGEGSRKSKAAMDHGRLIWTFLYLADRQISVRLGQSFWSRGPSLSSRFTAADFPMLKPDNEDDEDFSKTHEANLQLTQMLHNAHDVLYSSRARTLALVFAGDYGRYIDDFQKAAVSWHATWINVPRTSAVRRTLLLTYEYLGVYVNAFSFQAVLTRHSSDRAKELRKTGAKAVRSLQNLESPFGAGVMSSPDGRYIFDALSSARAILGLMASMSPYELCTLPSRYHLYGVYAAVFMYKAEQAGAITSEEDRQEADDLVTHFIETMSKTGPDDLHIARHYGAMLEKMWSRKNNGNNNGAAATQLGISTTQQQQQNQNTSAWTSQAQAAGDYTTTSHQPGAHQVQQLDSNPRNAEFYQQQQQGAPSATTEFPTPQLVDPDIGLLDTQMAFNPFAVPDFSDVMADPFNPVGLDLYGEGDGWW